MRIYLAELFHTFVAANRETSSYTVPLGVGFLAATIRQRLPGVEVELFRDPDQLIEAIRRQPPSVLGLSVCNWNIDLSRRLARYVKAAVPGIITVAGGPSVDDQDGSIVDFFGRFPARIPDPRWCVTSRSPTIPHTPPLRRFWPSTTPTLATSCPTPATTCTATSAPSSSEVSGSRGSR